MIDQPNIAYTNENPIQVSPSINSNTIGTIQKHVTTSSSATIYSYVNSASHVRLAFGSADGIAHSHTYSQVLDKAALLDLASWLNNLANTI